MADNPSGHWVATYDIADHQARRRLARLLEQWGERVQFSVFHLRLAPSASLRFWRLMSQVRVAPGDRLAVYPVRPPVVQSRQEAWWLA